MELTLAALALNVFTAWVVMADVERLHPTPHRPRRQRERAPRPSTTTTPRSTAPAADPWLVEPEPLVVGSSAELVGKPASTGEDGPVLAYIERPRRQPDATKLIQTEVLVRSGVWARAFAFVRLVVYVVAFGAILGLGVIGAARAIGALFSS